MLVADASIMVMLATSEPGSEEADRMVEGAVLAAPELVLAEAANALWRKARVGDIAHAEAVQAAKDIGRTFTRLVPLRALQDQAPDLALRRRGYPVYDCFYVALAMREAAPLLTAASRSGPATSRGPFADGLTGSASPPLPAPHGRRQAPLRAATVSGKRTPWELAGRARRPAPPRRG